MPWQRYKTVCVLEIKRQKGQECVPRWSTYNMNIPPRLHAVSLSHRRKRTSGSIVMSQEVRFLWRPLPFPSLTLSCTLVLQDAGAAAFQTLLSVKERHNCAHTQAYIRTDGLGNPAIKIRWWQASSMNNKWTVTVPPWALCQKVHTHTHTHRCCHLCYIIAHKHHEMYKRLRAATPIGAKKTTTEMQLLCRPY